MTGEDILRALGGIDYRLVMLGAPTDKPPQPKVGEWHSFFRRLAVAMVAIAMMICIIPLIQIILYTGEEEVYSYTELIGKSDAAVFATYKGRVCC